MRDLIKLEIKNEQNIFEKGKARLINLHNNNTGKSNEIFFSIKRKNNSNIYGYIPINEAIKNSLDKLIQDRIQNASIEVIEWDNCYLICINDGVFISTDYIKVSKVVLNKVFFNYLVQDSGSSTVWVITNYDKAIKKMYEVQGVLFKEYFDGTREFVKEAY